MLSKLVYFLPFQGKLFVKSTENTNLTQRQNSRCGQMLCLFRPELYICILPQRTLKDVYEEEKRKFGNSANKNRLEEQ